MNNSVERRYVTFAKAYVTNGFVAKSAAIAAGYSTRTAEVQGARLLRIAKVLEMISEFSGPVHDAYQVTYERVIEELANVAFADIGSLVDWDEHGARLRASKDLDPRARRAVKKLESVESEAPGARLGNASTTRSHQRVELHDKLGALNTLAKHLGIVPTTGKVRINVDQRARPASLLESVKGLTRADILRIAGVEE